MGISTHVLDTAVGRPAAGVEVALERLEGDVWHPLAAGVTDHDGRIAPLLDDVAMTAAQYRLTFATGPYFAARSERTFYPRVRIEFAIEVLDEHHHVPLLVSPWGYSTYRGS